MKKITSLLLVFFACVQLHSQNFQQISQADDGFAKIVTSKMEGNISRNADNSYGVKLKISIQATSVAVGWQTLAHKFQAGNFGIRFRMYKEGKGWTSWREDDCLINPDQNPLNIYKSDLLFGWDEGLHDSLEFYLYPPENEQITELYLFSQDISGYLSKKHSNEAAKLSDKSDHPAFPDIILRTSWCGSNNSCLNPNYSVVYRPNMTHTVIYHGASPASYTDGAAVVYSYWVYHTTASPNGNGWDDIGYNYLFDKYGNMFQGRHNPQLPNTDVHAAHAGYANTYSIGCNFLGDSDSPNTAPTEIQLNKCADLLAWWYDTHKDGLDPLSSASIHLQPADGGSAVKPRICGHRDVHPGGTTCPGDALYALLPTIRTKTAQKIAACQNNAAPTTEIMTGKEWQNGDFLAHFNDADENSDIKYAFYNVEYQQNSVWRTNTDKGFLKEDFSAPSNNWIPLVGSWSIVDSNISINNAALASSNDKVYTLVQQNNGNVFLYNFKIKFNGTAANARAAFHFLCDDLSSASNFEATGKSYAIFFYQTQNKVQIYRWTPYVYTAQQNCEFNPDTWYDIKIILNTITREISLYKNNEFVMSWTDTETISHSGNAVVLKVRESNVSFDDVTVYKHRTVNQVVTLGSNADIPVESPDFYTPAGKINTILTDNFGNWSQMYSRDIFVDLNNQIHPENIHDTLYITQHDTTYLTEYQYIHDTIYIYDCDVPTMIEELENNQISLYPNPTNDILWVEISIETWRAASLSSYHIEIFDIDGKRVHYQNINNEKTAINIQHFAKGSYILRVFSDNKAIGLKKIVKK